MVSKFGPARFGSRNVFLVKSHVPSPTVMVSDEYSADPGADSPSADAMLATSPCFPAVRSEGPAGWFCIQVLKFQEGPCDDG